MPGRLRKFGFCAPVLPLLHPQIVLAQSSSEPAPPTPSSKSEMLPPLTVEAPPRSSKPRHAAKQAARKPSVTPPNPAPAAASTAATSGAPDIGYGPAPVQHMASQITVSGEELNARPVTRPGEVLEAVPGLIVTQHSGEGKANQYFLRGYNLDHGTDLAICGRRRAGQHAHPRARPGLCRPELADAGDDRLAGRSARARISPTRAISARPATCTSA